MPDCSSCCGLCSLAIVITMVLAFPGTVGIHDEQRALLGIATVVMLLESIVISAIDVCKCMNL